MAAIKACPDCPQKPKTEKLADIAPALELHRQNVHGNVSRNGSGSKR